MENELRLESRQKAAAILLAIGNTHASKLISHLKLEEIQAMMLAAESLRNLTPEALNVLVDEFEEGCLVGTGLIDSSVAFHSLIEESLTPEQFTELSVGPDAAQIALKKTSIWELLETIEDAELIEFLISENPQISSYILSRISSKKAAIIIGKLNPLDQKNIVAGMITSRPAIKEAVTRLEKLVTKKFGPAIGANKGSGNQHLVAGMMNELDAELSDDLFTQLTDVVQPQQLQTVRSLMFRFDDILSLEKSSLSALFDQVSTELTTLALRGGSKEIQQCVLDSIGQRTRRMMESELEIEMPVSPEDIQFAQREIASTALKLASDGTITIPAPDIAA